MFRLIKKERNEGQVVPPSVAILNSLIRKDFHLESTLHVGKDKKSFAVGGGGRETGYVEALGAPSLNYRTENGIEERNYCRSIGIAPSYDSVLLFAYAGLHIT
jgi:hypothetical protein